ncbi:MAG: DEAD/DEAH box helicase [Cellulomonadaceae bacterium]|jgi:ATP-dependent RNA helicase HelY|nr:DEAD/DEAH box helicase [Cellulomonadaceae bacterium]
MVKATETLSRFASSKSFPLDDYQVAACVALIAGKSVLVAAPTGAGKTVVGEFAIELALAAGGKAFYTTPIKALSNQKYRDLVSVHGSAKVGLLTGDTAINPTAEIVVMTTEVLRNMLYSNDSDLLVGLQFVIIDEVHYLADKFRGPVWEEIIIHLPDHVALVALSATVSNAEEFGEWLAAVRRPVSIPAQPDSAAETDGSTAQPDQGTAEPGSSAADTVAIVVSEHRPVPLFQHVAVAEKSPRALPLLLDLYADDSAAGVLNAEAEVSPDLVRTLTPLGGSPGGRRGSGDRQGRSGSYWRERYGRGATRQGGGAEFRKVTRPALVAALDADGLLPAIYFIFSRAGCDGALEQLFQADIWLTSKAEQAEIAEIIERRVAHIEPQDLEVLGYWHWRAALKRGIAAHHAGMIAVFKETVEELFNLGLLKVVFATETLALGINMPARTVVLEKLDKWNGVAHVAITPGEYTQLTGRAGRRGIDIEGHAVVVNHQGLDPSYLGTLASKRTYPLISAFTVSYNMAVNLVAQVGYDRALSVLETSFAQFQADKSAVHLARQVRGQEQSLAGYREAMACDKGDFLEFLKLRHNLATQQRNAAKASKTLLRDNTDKALLDLKRGDVIGISSGRRRGYAVVVDPISGEVGRKATVQILTIDKQVKPLFASDIPRGFQIVGHLAKFPKGFSARRPESRQDLASSLRNFMKHLPEHPPAPAKAAQDSGNRAKLDALQQEIRDHPCQKCPDIAEHERWGARYQELEREYQKLNSKLATQTGIIARTFQRVCRVLIELGYLASDLDVTADGQWLRRIYLEQDLLLAECLRRGAWNELDAPSLAALVAALVFEGRNDDDPVLPLDLKPNLKSALERTLTISSELSQLARNNKLDPPNPLSFGLVRPILRWAKGGSLAATLKNSDLAPGDFVRWCKQVIDVLNQIAVIAPNQRLRDLARTAKFSILRGVVAYSALDTEFDEAA